VSEQKGLNRYFFQETIMHSGYIHPHSPSLCFDATHQTTIIIYHHHSQIQSLHNQKRQPELTIAIRSLNINHY